MTEILTSAWAWLADWFLAQPPTHWWIFGAGATVFLVWATVAWFGDRRAARRQKIRGEDKDEGFFTRSPEALYPRPEPCHRCQDIDAVQSLAKVAISEMRALAEQQTKSWEAVALVLSKNACPRMEAELQQVADIVRAACDKGDEDE